MFNIHANFFKKLFLSYTPKSPDRGITLDWLNSNGYDSTYAKAGISGVNYDEFVVYEPERVKQWIICYPSKYQSDTN